jgi:diaminopropionate ammonia-lyase
VRALVNPAADPASVAAPSDRAAAFHRSLPGYVPTPLRELDVVARELGLASVSLKDESDRLGLPAFKILGASWAIEQALREHPDTRTLVAASAGNHGRAVAHVAATRGLECRVFLPERSAPVRREAIAAEGAQLEVVDGTYEDAVALSAAAGREPGVVEIADVGDSGPAHAVIDGYATLFDEIAARGPCDVLLVPIGVGSLGAAAARFGAQSGAKVIGVEPDAAACLTASLAAGEPTVIDTPGTAMAGLDCAEVSQAAWPDLRAGVTGTITVTDDEAREAMAELADLGLAIGDCGAATLPALRALAADRELSEAVGLGETSSVVLVATEGLTTEDRGPRT